MQAYLITIGNEILIGDIVNTNASWLGQFFSRYHIDVCKSVSVGDDQQEITAEVLQGMEKADITIVTGGLGPTHDDVTKKTLATLFESEMIVHEPTRDFISKIFKKRNIPLSPSNLEQSEVPHTCTVLMNYNGTAPGMWFENNGKVVVALPGVPSEMKALMNDEVLPRISGKFGLNGHIHRHYFQVAGIGESTLSDLVIGKTDDLLNGSVSLAYLPHPYGITLRVQGKGSSDEEAKQNIVPLTERIREKASEYIYSEDRDGRMEEVVLSILRRQKKTLAVAESCSGGLLASKITDIPGSSDVFLGGFVAYHNSAKENLLGVSADTLKKHGAVSRETALEMAKGAAEKFGASVGISTTGVAEPGGGTEEKPVGTVWFGYYDGENHFAMKARFFKERLANKERTAMVALDIIRRVCGGMEKLPYGLKAEYQS